MLRPRARSLLRVCRHHTLSAAAALSCTVFLCLACSLFGSCFFGLFLFFFWPPPVFAVLCRFCPLARAPPPGDDADKSTTSNHQQRNPPHPLKKNPAPHKNQHQPAAHVHRTRVFSVHTPNVRTVAARTHTERTRLSHSLFFFANSRPSFFSAIPFVSPARHMFCAASICVKLVITCALA